MRLIDANKCPDCKDCIIRAYCDYTERFDGECIVELILKNQPTAYDISKVCEELERIRRIAFMTIANTGNKENDKIYSYLGKAVDDAINIVRK